MGASGSRWKGWASRRDPPAFTSRASSRTDGGLSHVPGTAPGIPLVGEPVPSALADQGRGLKDMPHGGRVASAGPRHAERAGFRAGDCGRRHLAHGAEIVADLPTRRFSAKRSGAPALRPAGVRSKESASGRPRKEQSDARRAIPSTPSGSERRRRRSAPECQSGSWGPMGRRSFERETFDGGDLALRMAG